jgi:hypothetical protein
MNNLGLVIERVLQMEPINPVEEEKGPEILQGNVYLNLAAIILDAKESCDTKGHSTVLDDGDLNRGNEIQGKYKIDF